MKNEDEKCDQHLNRVLEVWKEISVTERHFNDIETQYRILSSQWMLGAFAGIGYILTADKLELHRWLIITVIAFSSCVGIFQIWRMDLTIYHKLLHAAFVEGIKLEEKFTFLPPVKTEMFKSVPENDVTPTLLYFYFLSIAVLFLFGTLSLSQYISSSFEEGFSRYLTFIGSILAAIFILFLLRTYMKSQSKEKNKLNSSPSNLDK